MNYYTVIAAMGCHLHPSAVLALTDEQVARRRHALKDLGGGRYEVTAPVGFKYGERIGVEGGVNKVLLAKVEPEASAEAKEAEAAAKAEEEAAAKAKEKKPEAAKPASKPAPKPQPAD